MHSLKCHCAGNEPIDRSAADVSPLEKESCGLPAHDIETVVLASVRGLVGADVAPDMPLLQAGLDSLAALELRNELGR